MPPPSGPPQPLTSPPSAPTKRPTILDVARTAGVSTATVSHVINNSRYVSEEVRAEVLLAIKTLRYSPDPAARALRRRQAGTIGYLAPNVNSPLAAGMLSLLDAMASDQGIGIVVAQSAYSPAREREWLDILASQRLDVLLVWPVGPDTTALIDLHHDGQRLIQIVSPHDRPPFPKVATNLAAAGRLGVQHLAEHGYRRIAVLPGRRHTAEQALRGVRDYVSACGRSLDLLVERSDDTHDDALLSIVELLQRPDRPEAILTLTVAHFEACLAAVRMLKLNMPGDVALVALSDQRWLPYLRPSITAIRQDVQGMAHAVIDMVRRVRSRAPLEPHHLIFEPALVVGESCGCTVEE